MQLYTQSVSQKKEGRAEPHYNARPHLMKILISRSQASDFPNDLRKASYMTIAASRAQQ
jgi:hypothetical protein